MSRACYFGTPGDGFGEVSGAHRLMLFVQLDVAHKHFRLAKPTQSAQKGEGGVELSMLNRRQINRNPEMIVSQNCIDFGMKTYRFGHISSQS